MNKFTRDDLVTLMDIRGRLKDESGVKLLLASPSIYKDMEEYWHLSRNAITKSKIRAFLNDKKVAWHDPMAPD